MGHNPERDHTNESEKEDLELPLFDFDTIAEATDNFSRSNKLGQGGFGPVYKVSILYGYTAIFLVENSSWWHIHMVTTKGMKD